jgi:hypothetical protein
MLHKEELLLSLSLSKRSSSHSRVLTVQLTDGKKHMHAYNDTYTLETPCVEVRILTTTTSTLTRENTSWCFQIFFIRITILVSLAVATGT